jgi:DivIVA domain-containing protein
VPLDRQSIEKKDFPIDRRGYSPEAVDAHLAEIAADVDELRRASQRRSGASLASAASEQVRAIVEAAETSAAEIERQAESDAERIRAEASTEADRTRQEAIARSQEHVGKVGEASALMLQRVDAMESELSALIESLRTGGNRLNADLSLLQGNMGELYGAAGAGAPAAAAPPPPAPRAPESTPAPAQETAEEELVAGSNGGPAEAPAPPPAAGGDVEGARLVALNMALNGQSREETDRYLAENFDLEDRDALLDEVYSTVEG